MRIQELRQGRGWTQEELSLHSGLSVRTIQRIESGRPATLETLKCLAAVFETRVADLAMEQPEMMETEQESAFSRAEENEAIHYVQNLKGFHLHWMSFAVVVLCLLGVNLLLTPEYLWVLWVVGSWGLGIALHAVMLFGMFGLFDAEWEQRQFRKRLASHRGGRSR